MSLSDPFAGGRYGTMPAFTHKQEYKQPVSHRECTQRRVYSLWETGLPYLSKKEWFPMLPCQTKCASYCAGCHKTCFKWNLLSRANRIDQQRKKAYLSYYNQRCSTVIRQCYQTLPQISHR